MGDFKKSYKNITPVLTGLVIVGVILGFFVAIYASITKPSDLSGLGPVMCCFADGIFLIICSAINVVLSLTALNSKAFQNPKDKKFARIIFWINVLLIPGLIMSYILIGVTCDLIRRHF